MQDAHRLAAELGAVILVYDRSVTAVAPAGYTWRNGQNALTVANLDYDHTWSALVEQMRGGLCEAD